MKSFLELGSTIHQAAETASQIEEIVEAVEAVEPLRQTVEPLQIKVDSNIPSMLQNVWAKTLEETGSPAMALQAAKALEQEQYGRCRLRYNPHQGKKERLRRQNQLTKMQEKANV